MTATATTTRVVCKLCGEHLTLTPDCEASRKAGTDPHQQLRKHLLSHFAQTMAASRHLGWMTDMMCFSAADNPEAWRESMIELLDMYIKQNGVKLQ